MASKRKRHAKRAARRSRPGSRRIPEPVPRVPHVHWSGVERALTVAQRAARLAQSFVFLSGVVGVVEWDTAPAAVKAARAMLLLAPLALRSLRKFQR